MTEQHVHDIAVQLGLDSRTAVAAFRERQAVIERGESVNDWQQSHPQDASLLMAIVRAHAESNHTPLR